jgi:type II secretory ATPase GspE/PulE/Tfp pilus assembly ATPase PilB-like protein
MPEVRLGKLLLENELVTAGQIQDALVKQLSTPEVPLGKILCQMGALRSNDLELLLNGTNKRQKLIEILLKNKLIDESGLNDATALSQTELIPLEKALLKLNLLSEEHLARTIAIQYNLPYMDIAQFHLDPEQARILNANFALKHKIVPIASDGKNITVAMAFPLPRNEFRHIEKSTRRRVIPVIAKECDIAAAMQQLFNIGSPPAATNATPSFDIAEDVSRDTAGSKTINDVTSAHVDLLLKKIFFLGITRAARDIHFESAENGMAVRFRIDGMLQTLDIGKDKELINASGQHIISRIKTLSDMDIAERRRPQDGSFAIKATKADDSRRIDLRVSTVPARYGENMVIRIFDKSSKVNSLENLGFYPDQVKELIHALNKPAGIFLVTGPTDSGKSSTLYAFLSKIITPESKTLTVENPIEYALEGATQTEVNEILGNTYAKMLLTFLRQDPDNILVDEIRDSETARIALHAALTGHTVLSTLSTHDSTSVVTRLIDLGIEASIVSSTLRCVLAQRMVRLICRECAALDTPSQEILAKFGFPSTPRLILKKGKGCAACNYTGYSGRRPIIELWLPTREELKMNRKSDISTLRQRVFGHEERATLLEDGFRRVLAGETTLDELLRVIPTDQIESDRDRLKPMLLNNS